MFQQQQPNSHIRGYQPCDRADQRGPVDLWMEWMDPEVDLQTPLGYAFALTDKTPRNENPTRTPRDKLGIDIAAILRVE